MVVSMEIRILNLTKLKRKIQFDHKLERGLFKIMFWIPFTMSGLISLGIGCTSSPWESSEGSSVMHLSPKLNGEERGPSPIWVNCSSPVRFRPKPRQLKSTRIWANRPSSKVSKLLFPVIKPIKSKLNFMIFTGIRRRTPFKNESIQSLYTASTWSSSSDTGLDFIPRHCFQNCRRSHHKFSW